MPEIVGCSLLGRQRGEVKNILRERRTAAEFLLTVVSLFAIFTMRKVGAMSRGRREIDRLLR